MHLCLCPGKQYSPNTCGTRLIVNAYVYKIANFSSFLCLNWRSDFIIKDRQHDDSSDDDKKSLKKALASIAINNKPSIFDTPSTCLMAKSTKVKYDVSDDDCESDDFRSDDEEEYTKEELLDMCEQVH